MAKNRSRISSKKIIASMGILCLAVILIHVVHAFTLDRMVEYKELTFKSPQVTSELDGYRVAFISDIHEMDDEDLRAVVEKLNTMDINLLVLGGDFSSDGRVPRTKLELLSQVRTTDGVFAVEGNHDNRARLFVALEECGITPLSDSGLKLHANLYLAGVTDYWGRDSSIAQATEAALPGDFILLVSHNPDITMVQDTVSIDLILCGHTHGGQATFFGLFAPALVPGRITNYGHRFTSGWSTSRDNTPVYVSNGVGQYLQVPRVFARPQVIVITLREGA